jgi:hypothetical protein
MEIEASFRFLGLDKLQAITLEREIVGASQRKHFKHDCYVGSVPLVDQYIEDINNFYVRQRVRIEECDIFLSIVTESSSNIVEVPEIVNRLLKYIDCKLTFSFTVV